VSDPPSGLHGVDEETNLHFVYNNDKYFSIPLCFAEHFLPEICKPTRRCQKGIQHKTPLIRDTGRRINTYRIVSSFSFVKAAMMNELGAQPYSRHCLSYSSAIS
jgi:hypothetical protein